MSTFLNKSATSPSSSYPIVLTRLGGSRSRPNPYLKFVEVPGIEPATSWSVVRHANRLEENVAHLLNRWKACFRLTCAVNTLENPIWVSRCRHCALNKEGAPAHNHCAARDPRELNGIIHSLTIIAWHKPHEQVSPSAPWSSLLITCVGDIYRIYTNLMRHRI